MRCESLFQDDQSSNSMNNDNSLNEEVCFYLNENNSIQNVIYMKLKNTSNYFFEISKKQRVKESENNSNVLLLEDIPKYTRFYVDQESSFQIAKTLTEKIHKKSKKFLNIINEIGYISKFIFNEIKSKTILFLNKIKSYFSESEKIEEIIIHKEQNPKMFDNLKKQNKKKNKSQKINHVENFDSLLKKKILFLNKNIIDTKLTLPAQSSLNIPRMIFIDFHSQRNHLYREFSEFYYFDRFNKSKPQTDSIQTNFSNIVNKLQDMVLVIKNNLTVFSLIPIE